MEFNIKLDGTESPSVLRRVANAVLALLGTFVRQEPAEA